MTKPPPTLLIGGLPAQRWVGRRIRMASHPSSPHMMRATLVRILTPTTVLVKPDGHRRCDHVPLSIIRPWWSQNPDLKPPKPCTPT